MPFICSLCGTEFEPESGKEYLLMIYSEMEGKENPCSSCISFLVAQLEEVERLSLEKLVDSL